MRYMDRPQIGMQIGIKVETCHEDTERAGHDCGIGCDRRIPARRQSYRSISLRSAVRGRLARPACLRHPERMESEPAERSRRADARLDRLEWPYLGGELA